MNSVIVSLLLIMIFLINIPNNVSSQENDFYWGDPIPPRLFLDNESSGGEGYYLAYGELNSDFPVDNIYFTETLHYSYYYDGGLITLNPNETITLTIKNVCNRLYNPNIDIELCINPGFLNPELMRMDTQMRCDGKSDGHFEYIIDFKSIPFSDSWVHFSEPSSTSGQISYMDGGIIELVLSASESNPEPLTIQCNSYSYLQIPFDLDTDNDGTTDYSDPDDDNDGYTDRIDRFPLDHGEWKDTDGDGIGDNTDPDFNGNNIPDDLEIPLAMGIVLIPLIVIMVIMNKMKKKGKEEEEGEWGEEDIPILTTPHEGPKNW